MARNGKRLGFLPDWRIFTYIILVVNLIFLIWIIAGASSSNDTSKKSCGSLDVKTCNDAQNVGKGIGATIIIVLWVLVDIILLVLWLITNRKKRECPVCGHNVKKGQMQCKSCGHDFRAAAHSPQQPGYVQQQQPPAGWMPDPSGSGQMRWWDGQRYTEHTQPPTAGAPSNRPRPRP